MWPAHNSFSLWECKSWNIFWYQWNGTGHQLLDLPWFQSFKGFKLHGLCPSPYAAAPRSRRKTPPPPHAFNGPFSFFPASPPSTISRDLAQNIADRVGAILGLRLVVGEGKAAKGDYSKYRKPPPGIERSGTPRPGAPLVWQKVIELLRYEDHLLGFV